MKLWLIIMWSTLILTGMALVYVSTRVCRFGCIKKITKDSEKLKALIGGGLVFGLFAVVGVLLNFMNAVVCIIYFALVWLICDFSAWIISKIRKRPYKRYYAGGFAIILSLIALSWGWYADHHVWQTDYTLSTSKQIEPLKIALLADSHLGTTFNASGFAHHLDTLSAQSPDLIIIAGDFVDDDTSREDMVAACHKLGQFKTKYGIYFVFGNHDKGYYGAAHRGFSAAELVAELEQNGIVVLQDEVIAVGDHFSLIGRRDASVERERGGRRLSMQELVTGADSKKYLIVADHQPTDYKNQAASGVDLVVSGHTHGGQLFPFNQVGKWIGANDLVYGHEKHQNTDFIVTSGISDWAIKFKTGTKSEYVIITINPQL